MAVFSRRTALINALAARVRTTPSVGTLGSVNAFPRNPFQVRDYPSIDIVLGDEVRTQEPSLQAKYETDWFVWVHHGADQQSAIEDLCNEVSNTILAERQFLAENGGVPLVTTTWITGTIADLGVYTIQGAGLWRAIQGRARFHVSET